MFTSHRPLPRIMTCALLALAAGTAAAQSLEENEHYSTFKNWALNTQYPDPVPNMFRFCVETYDKMIASGVSADAVVPEEEVPGLKYGDPPIQWRGTVQEIKRNWCEAGLTQIRGEVDSRHAPYRAVLRNDKLDLVIDETHGHVSSFAMPGGKYTDDPGKLAAAAVWFLDLGAPSNEVQNCVNGAPRKIVRRYTFDDDQVLLDTTEKEYCGNPPAEAYR
jgi:hypothetical protein